MVRRHVPPPLDQATSGMAAMALLTKAIFALVMTIFQVARAPNTLSVAP